MIYDPKPTVLPRAAEESIDGFKNKTFADDYGPEPAQIANAIKKLNFRESFEAWHKARYGFIGKYAGTAMHITYQTSTVQQRWEGWQACAEQHSKTKF